ncbi:hypothetical protein [Loigolactobacillus iwatensis]|uniref:hypothetical protein n=1 Tax=Loigolactobacillus iwatensis TaxID=1267156 RepID=UPI000F7D9C8B|nr:hypothetical protein [Loigolactobacillus iwatensis]
MTWEHFLEHRVDDQKGDGHSVTVDVPNAKEQLTLKIDADVYETLAKENGKLEQLVKHLLSRHRKQTTKETIVINKRNLRIFL